jgi:hypothetical protein
MPRRAHAVREFNTAADLCAGAQIGSWAAPTVHR